MEVTEHGQVEKNNMFQDGIYPQSFFVQVNFLEHVQAHITLTSARRGDIQIFLTSPGGTKSTLLAKRPHDSSRAGFHAWPFLTVFCWGEHPAGTWELEVQNVGRSQVIRLISWSMTFHGTETNPDASQPTPTPSPEVDWSGEGNNNIEESVEV